MRRIFAALIVGLIGLTAAQAAMVGSHRTLVSKKKVVSGGGGATTTFDPVNTATHITLSGGNLIATANASDGNGSMARGLTNHSSGTYYAEFTVTAVGTAAQGMAVGVVNSSKLVTNANSCFSSTNATCYFSTGKFYFNSITQATVATYTTGDVIGMLVDTAAGTLTWYKNNVSQGSLTPGITGALYPIVEVDDNTASITANFGATAYTYSHPALNW